MKYFLKMSFKKQIISKDVEDFEHYNHIDLTDIYKTFHPTTVKYKFFLSASRTLAKIFWAIKQISVNLKGLKSCRVYWLTTIELNQKSITDRYPENPQIIGTDNTLTNNRWVKTEITKNIRKYFVVNENENPIIKNLGCT